ncbi:MAG TPA: histidine decarboxylase, pyruvoyl type [Desulfomonilaceae bacterium]|nr:histidine decarboxylase, pyruvoyl type [Desulfomonilaceae bacterium]
MPEIFGGKKAKDVARILKSAVSPYAFHCEGFGNNDSKGCYINTPLIAGGTAVLKNTYDRSLVLEQIQAFDTAEAEGAYIGQINLFQVSSFCGPNGLIWGHDVMECRKPHAHQCDFGVTAGKTPVFDAGILFEASARLFGTAQKRRFPVIPGSVVPAAYKTISEIGPVVLYGGLGIGIAEDKASSASLFMEYVAGGTNLGAIESEKEIVSDKLLGSVLAVGENHDVEFEMIYVGTRALVVPEGSMGCVLVAVPYVTLAGNALPKGIMDCPDCVTIDEWEAQVSHLFYHRVRGRE